MLAANNTSLNANVITNSFTGSSNFLETIGEVNTIYNDNI